MAQLPQTYDEIKAEVQLLIDTVTGSIKPDALDLTVAGTEIIQYACHLMGADKPPVIGMRPVDLQEEHLEAINNCLAVLPPEPQPKGGFLAQVAIQRILKELVRQIMLFLQQFDGKNPSGELWDGAILKILLENLPMIIAAIASLFNKED